MTTSTVSRPTDEQEVSRRHLVRYVVFLEAELDQIPEQHPLHAEFTSRVADIRRRIARPTGVLEGSVA